MTGSPASRRDPQYPTFPHRSPITAPVSRVLRQKFQLTRGGGKWGRFRHPAGDAEHADVPVRSPSHEAEQKPRWSDGAGWQPWTPSRKVGDGGDAGRGRPPGRSRTSPETTTARPVGSRRSTCEAVMRQSCSKRLRKRSSMRWVNPPPDFLPPRGPVPPVLPEAGRVGASPAFDRRRPPTRSRTPAANITRNPSKLMTGNPPGLTGNATPAINSVNPKTNSTPACSRCRFDAIPSRFPRTVEANLGSSA